MFAISDTVKGWLVKGVMALLCVGAVWGVFQIFEAKDKRIEAQAEVIKSKDQQIEQKSEELKQAKAEGVQKGKSDDMTETVKAEVKKEEAKPVAQKTLAQQYVDNKLDAINDKYAKLEQSAANEERKRAEISLERAKGLWLTYCLQEPQVAACK